MINAKLLNEKVHYYIHLRYDGFVQLIDDLGGVEVSIEKNMDYEDHANKLYIHFKKGKRTKHKNKTNLDDIYKLLIKLAA